MLHRLRRLADLASSVVIGMTAAVAFFVVLDSKAPTPIAVLVSVVAFFAFGYAQAKEEMKDD